jgi:PKD repeat protein
MSDPSYASVVLLAVNDNAANGSTTFVDQSPVARTLTAVGNIAYSNAAAPTGMTTSAVADGTGDYLSSVNSADFNFGNGNFTIEFMYNFSVVGTQCWIAKDNTTQRSWQFTWVNGIGFQFLYVVGGGVTLYRPGNPAVSAGNWYHIAAVRNGTSLVVYFNGSAVGVANNIGTQSLDAVTAIQTTGSTGAPGTYINGNISNVRVTKGVARYTGNFTPPSLPFATSAASPPVADFTGTPTSGTAPLSVTFTDTSTESPTSWAWDFGDGNTATTQNPTNNYAAAGTYTVSLEATNAGGSDTKTRTGYITVTAPAPAATGGGGGGVAKWGRSEYGWEKWRRLEDKKLARKRAEAEKKVVRLEKQTKELRLEIQSNRDLEDLQRLMKKLEALQTRLEKAQAIVDEIEMDEVLLVWNLVR